MGIVLCFFKNIAEQLVMTKPVGFHVGCRQIPAQLTSHIELLREAGEITGNEFGCSPVSILDLSYGSGVKNKCG